MCVGVIMKATLVGPHVHVVVLTFTCQTSCQLSQLHRVLRTLTFTRLAIMRSWHTSWTQAAATLRNRSAELLVELNLVGGGNRRLSWWLTFDSKRSQVLLVAVPLLGQVVHTPVSLSPTSIIWYQSRQWCPASGKVIVGLALHCPCVTDCSGLDLWEM